MKILPSRVITTIEEAQFLLEASVISFDIETDTEPKTQEWADHAKNYGLSYVADITDVAFYTPGFDPVVLDMRGYPEETCDFIRQIFSKPSARYIAHNAVFDFRGLGGHLGFRLPLGVEVWDTQVMSIRLTISDGADDDESGASGSKSFPLNFQPSSLRALLDLHGIVTDPDEKQFLAFMKDNRAWLSNMEDVVKRLYPEHVMWRILGEGSYERSRDDQQRPAIVQHMVNLYVALDAVSTYYLYARQVEIVEQIKQVSPPQKTDIRPRSIKHEVAPNVVIPSWPDVDSHVNWELRIARVLANQAIRGVKIDIPYTNKMLAREIARHQEFGEFVRSFPDPTDAIPNWEKQFMMVWWYDMILTSVKKKPSDKNRGFDWVGTYSMPKSDQNWQYFEDFDLDRLDLTGENVEVWREWLRTIRPITTATTIRSSAPEGEPPTLDLNAWVESTSTFNTDDKLTRMYLAQIKAKYWSTWVKDREGRLPEDFDSFDPYFMFVKAGIPFPDNHDLRYIKEVKTNSFRDEVLYKRDENNNRRLQDEDDALQEALYFGLKNPKVMPFGTGHKALTFLGKKYLGWDEDKMEENQHPTAIYWKFMRAEAKMQTLEMFLRHASRDGRIHTMMQRARTGRNRSQQPNIQNIHMEDYAGMLIGDPGHWLVGLDFTNAENKSGASIARDNAFARATEEGDFHMNMAWSYEPELMAELDRKGDKDAMRKVRKKNKKVTFAVPYGAGASKIAEELICSIEKALEILEARKRAFPMVEEAKQRWIERIDSMYYYHGLRVPYVTNWAGSRIRVPVTEFYGKVGPKKNAIWNYLQQSSVADLVLRAMVEITEHWEIHGFKTWLAFNVHDELVIEVCIPEYYEVIQDACTIMNHTFPKEWARRTIPAVHNVADHGPENYFKWGYTENFEDYPFPFYEFINEWGVFPIPESERTPRMKDQEHPVWLGPVHLGWTLEQEIKDIAAGCPEHLIGLPKEEDDMNDKVAPETWEKVAKMVEEMIWLGELLEELMPELIEIHAMPEPVQYNYTDKSTGEQRTVVAKTPAKRLEVMTELANKGYLVKTYNRYMATIERASELTARLSQIRSIVEEAKSELSDA